MDGINKYRPPALIAGLTIVLVCLLSQVPAVRGGTGEPPELRVERVEKSHRRVPEWVRRVPETDSEYLYFVGRSTGGITLEGAEQDAAAEALRQIVTMIGLEASWSYERIRSQSRLLLEDRVSLDGGARVVGLKRLETWYEKVLYRYRHHTGDSLSTRYNASILVRYPVRALAKERKRMEQEAIKRVKIAGEQLVEGRYLESLNLGSRAGEAMACYTEGLGLLEGPQTCFMPSSLTERHVSLKRSLLESARSLGLRQRQVTVGPGRMSGNGGGETWQDEQMGAALGAAMQEHGFRLAREPENLPECIFMSAAAECRQERDASLGDGFYLSRWSASISFTGPDENTVLAREAFYAKGFGPDPERASSDALRKLRVEIFHTFARQARQELDHYLSREAGSRAGCLDSGHTTK
ncbi:MAG: hypothetical protein U9P14_08425 [Gemmatimonadota bacterium]|nr:hypothetical protein [Gemmatimonadota bacterium]